MIKDDIMRLSVYESPPENQDLAEQRMQLLYARELIPMSAKEAKEYGLVDEVVRSRKTKKKETKKG